MRILITTSGTPHEKEFAAEIAKQALLGGYHVHFLKRSNAPSPFIKKFDLTVQPATVPFMDEIADFHNFCERYRPRYEETIFDPRPTSQFNDYKKLVLRLQNGIKADFTIRLPKDLSNLPYGKLELVGPKMAKKALYHILEKESTFA